MHSSANGRRGAAATAAAAAVFPYWRRATYDVATTLLNLNLYGERLFNEWSLVQVRTLTPIPFAILRKVDGERTIALCYYILLLIIGPCACWRAQARWLAIMLGRVGRLRCSFV